MSPRPVRMSAVDRTVVADRPAARHISRWLARMVWVDRTVAAGHPVVVGLMGVVGLTEAARAAITGECRPADTRVPATEEKNQGLAGWDPFGFEQHRRADVYILATDQLAGLHELIGFVA